MTRQIVISLAGRKAWKFGPWLKAEVGTDSCFQVAFIMSEKKVVDATRALKACVLGEEGRSNHEQGDTSLDASQALGSKVTTGGDNPPAKGHGLDGSLDKPLPSNTNSVPPGEDHSSVSGTITSITFCALDFSILPPPPQSSGIDGGVRERTIKFCTEASAKVVDDDEGSRAKNNSYPVKDLILPLMGPTILQSVECPHQLVCKSRAPIPSQKSSPFPSPKKILLLI